MARIDLTGQKFGRLSVLGFSHTTHKFEAFWKCLCDCGKTVCVSAHHLRSNATKSCGCLQKERTSETHRKHGDSGGRLWNTWNHMKQRCSNPQNKAFSRYGGRGIKVCREWEESFEAFKDWALSNGYSEELTIDRIDTNGNYEPSNCRWATAKEQNNNKRNNVLVSYNDQTHTLQEWSEITGIPHETLRRRNIQGKIGPDLFKGAKKVITE